jgi:nucleotide-binding universal stress UspA family protein
MYEVVCCVDTGGDAVPKQVDAIAGLPGAAEGIHATVLHVFGDNPSGASATQVASVRRAVDRLEAAGIEAEVAEESGDPTATIERIAAEVDADLVCIGGRRRSPTGKALFGSVTQTVILGADRPVLVVDSAETDEE